MVSAEIMEDNENSGYCDRVTTALLHFHHCTCCSCCSTSVTHRLLGPPRQLSFVPSFVGALLYLHSILSPAPGNKINLRQSRKNEVKQHDKIRDS